MPLPEAPMVEVDAGMCVQWGAGRSWVIAARSFILGSMATVLLSACGGAAAGDDPTPRAPVPTATATATAAPSTATSIPPTRTPIPPTATPTPLPLSASRISWQGQEWYLHGANLPWYAWGCDFGCGANGGASSASTRSAIRPALRAAADAGMVNIRWWMFPGDPWQIARAADGTPTGIDPAVYADIDAALALADELGLYYTFVLFSGPEAIPRSWMSDASQREALAAVLGEGLFRRYADHPRILSWEIVNEPEFRIWSGEFTRAEVVDTVKAIAAQANAETTSLVTVGSATLDGLELWVGAGLDYYQAHWYDYMQPGAWCARCVTYPEVRRGYGLDAPLVIGEYYGGPDADAAQRLEDWYAKGYAGAWAWSLLSDRTADKMAIDEAASAGFAAEHADVGPR